jgi:hypothetical protein
MKKPSKEFIECYQHFNVYDMTEKIKKLSNKEKYLLLACALDNHDEEQISVLNNFSPFQTELNEIMEVNQGSEIKNTVFYELKEYTGSKDIDVTSIELPKIYTKQEARQIKLNKILDN